MDGKPKIAIIAGCQIDEYLLRQFNSWSDTVDATIFMFESRKVNDFSKLQSEIRLFHENHETPGYMQGLEDKVSEFNLVIAIGANQLSSFQAMRAAKKAGLPFITICSDTQLNFYQKYKNIWSIRRDVLLQSDQIWTTSKLAKSTLMLEGISEQKINHIPLSITLANANKLAAGREKFRKYIGIDQDDFLILFHHPLESIWNPVLLLEAMKLGHRQKLFNMNHIKLLYCGTGSLSDELKYLAYNLGIGNNALFLHQDTTPFKFDLLASCDASVHLYNFESEGWLGFPADVVESLAYGVRPIVEKGTVYEEMAELYGTSIAKPTKEFLALAVREMLAEFSSQRKVSRNVSTYNSINTSFRDQTIGVIFSLIRRYHTNSTAVDIANLIENIEFKITTQRYSEALVEIEDVILKHDPKKKLRSKILCLKGDILANSNEFEQALEAYLDCLRAWDKNYVAYRGLGQVSWKSHSNQEALIYFRKALAICGDDCESMLGLGLVYKRIGLNEEAIHWLNKCLGFSQVTKQSMMTLAQLANGCSDKKQGISILESAIDLVGEHPTLLMSLGELLLEVGETKRGSHLLQKALNNKTQQVV